MIEQSSSVRKSNSEGRITSNALQFINLCSIICNSEFVDLRFDDRYLTGG